MDEVDHVLYSLMSNLIDGTFRVSNHICKPVTNQIRKHVQYQHLQNVQSFARSSYLSSIMHTVCMCMHAIAGFCRRLQSARVCGVCFAKQDRFACRLV